MAGYESGQWSTKIIHLAALALQEGTHRESKNVSLEGMCNKGVAINSPKSAGKR